MAIPGMDIKDVKVEVEQADRGPVSDYERGRRGSGYVRMLRISGTTSSENKVDQNASYYARELRRSSFERSIYLPNEVEGDPTATMKNGVLRITWPAPKQTEPIKNSKEIEIKCLDK